MPKSRKRALAKGAKSTAVRVKHKVGGRKSLRGAGSMSSTDIEKALANCRKRDRNKLRRAMVARGLTLA